MFYQLSDVLLWPVLAIDMLLVAALYFLPRYQQRLTRIFLYGAVVLLALITGVFKLLCASPGNVASTPIHVSVRSNHRDAFRSVYYLRQNHEHPLAVDWKSYMPGTSSEEVLEAEGWEQSLAIKINGQWRLTPVIATTPSEAIIDLEKASFSIDRTGDAAKAIASYRIVEIGSWLSSFLTLGFLFLLIHRIRYLGSSATDGSVASPWKPSFSPF
jgi:hypothetical protein